MSVLARIVTRSLLLSLGGLPLWATAGVAIGLYNPFNHGTGGVNEIASTRVQTAHQMLLPSLGDLTDTDYDGFAPFYTFPTANVYQQRSYSLNNYAAYLPQNINPFASPYRNLHLNPTSAVGNIGNQDFRFFDPIELLSSTQGSPGFTASAGSYLLASPQVDTGVGSATGSINNKGEMRLKVDVKASGGPGATPVAEGALQGTYTDKFTVNGPNATAATSITFAARAAAPVLDFSDGDFYNYAVGYQMGVFQRGQVPGSVAQNIKEYWSDTGLYWMDARLARNPITQIPDSIHIESIGDAPPGVLGLDYQREPLEAVDGSCPAFSSAESCGAYKYVREIPIANPLNASYDDPMMPFEKMSVSGKFVFNPLTGQYVRTGDIELPTGVELELVVNFFVIAGCSDAGLGTCEISIDGSHTSALGIQFTDPAVTLTSQSGFAFPLAAVPEPASYALLAGGLLLLAAATRGRRRRA